MTTTVDQARGFGVSMSYGLKKWLRGFSAMFSRGLRFDGRTPQRLLIAPHDLRTADATIANDIYRGRLSLAGAVADIGTTSPFLLSPPSKAWQEELLSFAWLRHLHAADDAVSRVHARALIGDWIAIQGRGHPVAYKPEVMARRIISWLSHSPLYLEKADPAYYQAVMKSLGRQLRHLSRHAATSEDGLPLLTTYIAMAYATLCISGLERLQARVGRKLAAELNRQVLPDGGHISRNPSAILELLLDLLPLRQTYLSRDIVPPAEIIGAIDRMLPMVRFFRHGDGDFALFNGMGRTPIGAISSVLAYDDTLGKHAEQAPHSGYQRLEGGKTQVLMDAGKPPPSSISSRAHGGCLSFELSYGNQRIITNCGTSAAMREEWRHAARLTAAHSTLSIDGASSVQFLGGKDNNVHGSPIVGGVKSVQLKREAVDDGVMVEARHDGYRALGLLHTRRLTLSADGLELEGQDRMTRSATFFSRTRAYAIRFHIHPSIAAELDRDGRTVVLTPPNGERWLFSAASSTPRLDESVFLADPKGARNTSQIVFTGQCGNEAVVKWRLSLDTGTGARRIRSLKKGEREGAVMPATDVDPLPASSSKAQAKENGSKDSGPQEGKDGKDGDKDVIVKDAKAETANAEAEGKTASEETGPGSRSDAAPSPQGSKTDQKTVRDARDRGGRSAERQPRSADLSKRSSPDGGQTEVPRNRASLSQSRPAEPVPEADEAPLPPKRTTGLGLRPASSAPTPQSARTAERRPPPPSRRSRGGSDEGKDGDKSGGDNSGRDNSGRDNSGKSATRLFRRDRSPERSTARDDTSGRPARPLKGPASQSRSNLQAQSPQRPVAKADQKAQPEGKPEAASAQAPAKPPAPSSLPTARPKPAAKPDGAKTEPRLTGFPDIRPGKDREDS